MTDPKPTPDPLEEALIALDERLDENALAAIRVLKRGHVLALCVNDECEAVGEPAPHAELPGCACGQTWPCPVLVEAAKKLRGEE